MINEWGETGIGPGWVGALLRLQAHFSDTLCIAMKASNLTTLLMSDWEQNNLLKIVSKLRVMSNKSIRDCWIHREKRPKKKPHGMDNATVRLECSGGRWCTDTKT